MAQLSRPYQIALLVAAVLAGVMVFALHGHSGGSSPSASSPSSSAAAPTTSRPVSGSVDAHGSSGSNANAQANAAAQPSHIYHGSAPGLNGLSRDINKAHHAVAESQQNAQRLEGKSAQASGETSSSGSESAAAAAPKTATSPQAATSPKTATSPTAGTHAGATSATSGTPASAAGKSSATTPAGQREVEADLAKGDIVALLFWNANGTDDVVVHRALRSIPSGGAHKLAIRQAAANQVASFGSVTRGVQIFTTPTLLVINKKGDTIVLTGVQDAFSIEQAIQEARQL